jgi:CubicO group peptidase (beta-lactamase class C family)
MPGMRAVENGLRREDQLDQRPTWTLQERMAHYRVPGVSVAVISGLKIDWAKGYGFASVETKAPVTPDTIFQAGSLGKAVTVAGALRAVQEGRLSLDSDINHFLRSWQLPENEHVAATPVTLRHLLGHTAGTTVSGYFGYFAEDPLPTLLQVLEGQHPANSPAVRVDLRPGTAWRYSGGGYCVVQQALIDVYGRPFPEIM